MISTMLPSNVDMMPIPASGKSGAKPANLLKQKTIE